MTFIRIHFRKYITDSRSSCHKGLVKYRSSRDLVRLKIDSGYQYSVPLAVKVLDQQTFLHSIQHAISDLPPFILPVIPL
jgi:hypothetical protein